jgi:hypothetical protein
MQPSLLDPSLAFEMLYAQTNLNAAVKSLCICFVFRTNISLDFFEQSLRHDQGHYAGPTLLADDFFYVRGKTVTIIILAKGLTTIDSKGHSHQKICLLSSMKANIWLGPPLHYH